MANNIAGNFGRGFLSIVSQLIGFLSGLERPVWAVAIAKNIFVRMTGIAMEEAATPIDSYPSVRALFTRELRQGARPLDQSCRAIVPCDSTLRGWQMISDRGTLIQVKGVEYAVAELVQQEVSAGVAVNMYLSPKDYHRVHAPLDGTVVSVTTVEGALYPVNDWAWRSVPQLFTRNERVIFHLRSASLGDLFLVMIGALNVGYIDTPFVRGGGSPVASGVVRYQVESAVECGDLLGIFALGSSVVVVFPSLTSHPVATPGIAVRLGQTLV